MHVVGGMAVDPVGIAHDGCRTRHPHELVMGNTGDRDVGLVGAAFIEHAGVHDITNGNVDVSGAQPLEQTLGVAALDQKLAEAGLIEDCNVITRCTLLVIDPRDPVLLAPGIVDRRIFARGREVVRALPAHLGTKAGIRCRDAVVHGRLAERARGRELTVRPRH